MSFRSPRGKVVVAQPSVRMIVYSCSNLGLAEAMASCCFSASFRASCNTRRTDYFARELPFISAMVMVGVLMIVAWAAGGMKTTVQHPRI